MKVETGVMVMKDGKGWGITYMDGKNTIYGWMDPENAPIHKPEYCQKLSDVTWKDSPYLRELLTAKLVKVTRTTTVAIDGAA
jgi:hypothetical protein